VNGRTIVGERSSVPEVVASFYSELRAVAADLNAVSDELGKSISEIDGALRNLNLGISVWVKIRGEDVAPERGDSSYWSDDLGYSKVSARWGICLRHVEGDADADMQSTEEWLFNDAPRALRLAAIDCIVELLQKLSEEGQATTKRIREKLADAQEVASAVIKASRAPRPRPLTNDAEGWARAAAAAGGKI
jgi:hypothetical protein